VKWATGLAANESTMLALAPNTALYQTGEQANGKFTTSDNGDFAPWHRPEPDGTPVIEGDPPDARSRTPPLERRTTEPSASRTFGPLEPSDGAYLDGVVALVALGQLILHMLAFFKIAIAIHLNGRVVNKHVVAILP